MERLKKQILITVSFIVLVISLTQAQKADEPVILKIDSTEILLSEFEYLYNKNYQKNPEAYSQESLEEYLDLFIKFKLKVSEARRQGLDKDPGYLQEFDTYRKQLVEPYLTDSKAIDDMVEEAYERMKQEVRASHILIGVPQFASPEDTLKAFKKAMEVYEKANAGEPFSELAAKYSADPSAKQNAGYLGYFTALQMVYEFENAAFATPEGKFSEPVRTKFGYHILNVLDKRPSNGSVKTAHIMIRSTQGMNPEDTLAAYRKILEVEKRLKNGEDWNTLCQQFSEDMVTKTKGGELKWFSAGSMLEPFAEAAFQLKTKGELSKPIRTPYGWHVIKLIDKEPIGSFKDMKSQLKRKVTRDSRSATTKKRFIERLKVDYDFKENIKVKNNAFASFDGSLLKGTWDIPENKKLLESTLLTLDGKRQNVRIFFQFVKKRQQPQRDSLLQNYIQRLYSTFVEESILKHEESKLPEKYPEFRHLEREYQEGLLLFQVMENEVWNAATKDTTGLRLYFEENQASYRWDERVEASIFSAESQALIDSLKMYESRELFDLPSEPMRKINFSKAVDSLGNTAKEVLDLLVKTLKQSANYSLAASSFYVKGESKSIASQRFGSIKSYFTGKGVKESQIPDFTSNKKIKSEEGNFILQIQTDSLELLPKQFTIDNALAMTVNTKVFEKGEEKILEDIDWKVGATALSKDGRHYYIVIKKLLPAGNKKLKEVRGQVISDYQTFLEEKWLEILNDTFNVQINKEALQSLVKG